jgi:P pilus assembly chaperone PapD
MLHSFLTRCAAVALAAAAGLVGASAMATGVAPETSMLAISEADGTAQMAVLNTDDMPMLLHSSVYSIPEDATLSVFALPPVIRLEPKGRQVVRFVLEKPDQPLTVQHLKRVTFEGIPPKLKKDNVIQMTVRHDLPLIISPKGLEQIDAPWKLLQWRLAQGQVSIHNPSAYVVRLSQSVDLMPGERRVALLKRTYVLPGETLSVDLPAAFQSETPTAVRLFPASPYGYAVDPYDAPLDVSPAPGIAPPPKAAPAS